MASIFFGDVLRHQAKLNACEYRQNCQHGSDVDSYTLDTLSSLLLGYFHAADKLSFPNVY
jgi:hypothetical protein